MKRLAYIDSLRGFAALMVAVLWHYQHFSNLFQSNSTGLIPPLYWFLPARFFFDNGDIMVDLFFVLSGVIFSYTYRLSIKSSVTSGYDFFIKRLSRLYPLHLLTLVLVTVLVNIYFAISHNYPIYEINDTYHFFLNIVFLQKGLFDKGYSFNAPAWSLSIEAIMYLLFYFQARYFSTIYTSVFLVLVGFVIYRLPYDVTFFVNHPIARGLMGFFVGCLLYEILIKNNIYLKYRYWIIFVFIIFSLIYYTYIRYHAFVPPQLLMIFFSIPLIAELHFSQSLRYMLENKFLKKLGDMSLSIYLIHVPIQMIFLLYFKFNNLKIQYDSAFLFFIYGSCVVIVSWFLHTLVEMPVQNWLRLKLKKY